MPSNAIVVVGLPSSGKTTFLAALWHLIFGRELPTTLSFDSIARGDQTHLNRITDRWLGAQEQERTLTNGDTIVGLNLLDGSRRQVHLTFPDVAGEVFSRMWEQRECDHEVAEMLRQGNVVLFIRANKISLPMWVTDITQQAEALGADEAEEQDDPVSWTPALAPTQVQLVSLLNMLAEGPLDIGGRKLCIMLSAWDKARGEGLAPLPFLVQKLPLLHQFLMTNRDTWDWQVYGVSAQGGDYDGTNQGVAPRPEAEQLRGVDIAARRIILTRDGVAETYDLTTPLAWLTT